MKIYDKRWQYIKSCWECNIIPRQDILDRMKKEEDKWSDLFMQEVYGGKK